MADGVGKWLNLGEASAMLGVSESTIRRWADSGEIRSFRTSGGHRRILEEDLHRIIGSLGPVSPAQDQEHISNIAIGRVKRRLSRGRGGHAALFDQFSPEVRDRLRLMGRQMVDLFAKVIVGGSRKERFVEDARAMGREYGRMLVGSGIGLRAAVATFNSLRRSMEETASQIAGESGLSTEEAVEAIEHVLDLADIVLEGMAEVYETSL